MPRSMTAFARCTTADAIWVCECRGVNHRFLDVSVRLPEPQRALEPAIRNRLTERFGRGSVELRVSSQHTRNPRRVVDADALDALADVMADVGSRIDALAAPTVLDALAWPGVLVEAANADDAQDQAAVLALVDTTLDEFEDSREREGAALGEVLRQRLAEVRQRVTQLAAMRPALRQRQTERLNAHIASMDIEVRAERLEQEIVIAMMRRDIDEELDRLAHHIDESERVLALHEPMGRRLDFLMQEFNREVNTICSKTDGVATTAAGVEMKVLVEQMREQVQNVE